MLMARCPQLQCVHLLLRGRARIASVDSSHQHASALNNFLAGEAHPDLQNNSRGLSLSSGYFWSYERGPLHTLHGFTNRDVRQKLAHTAYPLASEAEKQPGQVTRLFRRLHAHGLIAKIPHSRRWRVSLAGRRTMSTAIKLREVAYHSLFAAAA